MSLAVLAVHWCVNMGIAAARHQPVHSSLLSVVCALFKDVRTPTAKDFRRCGRKMPFYAV